MIDYPGKLSCVCFFQGCNFECPYCHNPDLVQKRSSSYNPVTEESLYAYLEGRRGFIDGVVISGGEPTLQEDLPSLCGKIKRMGYAVKLDTNGSQPRVIRRLIDEGLVDYVAMDIKATPIQYVTFLKNGCNVDDVFSSIKIIMGSGVGYEFRTTCVRPFVDPGTIENIAEIIRGADLYALQGFHPTGVLHPEFFRGIEPGYDHDGMMVLKSIAAPYVKKCIVR
ncbi:MAG: anaerobic ribonucleoside-triphosphate reductase activating protein [Desulfobacterales bacterium]|nr:anaerobic ribonucleoside-triphosphate reductase activating protein [Desulfobacterales bacterium]